MIKTTREQRKALFRVFQRCPVFKHGEQLTYRQFRRRVQPGPGCIMIRWAGMWLGIEPDGYTHS